MKIQLAVGAGGDIVKVGPHGGRVLAFKRRAGGTDAGLVEEIVARYRDFPILVAALKQVQPAVKSLMDESGKGPATDWGLVNDMLCAVSAALRAFGKEQA